MFLELYFKLFFLLTPFFVVSTFLSMTRQIDEPGRRRIAFKCCLAIWITALVLFFFGRHIFEIFGVTLNAFRIGSGAILFLSAVSLVTGRSDSAEAESGEEIAVVPLAIPFAVGPGTIGALMVLGADFAGEGEMVTVLLSITAAVVSLGLLLFAASVVERIVKKQGLSILSKLTGLMIAALSAQIIFAGVRGFLSES